MSAKPLKLFIVRDKKAPNAVPRLIKAETKGQVAKFLSNSISIEQGESIEVADIMGQHPGLVPVDASAGVEDADESSAATPPTGSGEADPAAGEGASGAREEHQQAS